MTQVVQQETTDGAVARGLARPDVLGALKALSRLVGPERALADWQLAATARGLHGMALSPEDLLAIAAELIGRGGPTAIAGHSLSARVRAYQVLARHTDSGGAPR